MASMAEQICGVNAFLTQQGGPITIVAGQLEHLKILPLQQVDFWLHGMQQLGVVHQQLSRRLSACQWIIIM